jgi:galactokinase
LTGAGWGGCTVSLVSVDMLDVFCAQVKQQFYVEVLKMDANNVTENVLFFTQPGSGACVLKE